MKYSNYHQYKYSQRQGHQVNENRRKNKAHNKLMREELREAECDHELWGYLTDNTKFKIYRSYKDRISYGMFGSIVWFYSNERKHGDFDGTSLKEFIDYLIEKDVEYRKFQNWKCKYRSKFIDSLL